MCVDMGVDTCTSPGGSERQRICCMLHAVSCTRSCVYTQHLSVQHSHMNGVHHVRMSCVWRSCRAWTMHACCSAYVCCVCALHASAVTRVCLHGMASCICVPPCRGCVVYASCVYVAHMLHGICTVWHGRFGLLLTKRGSQDVSSIRNTHVYTHVCTHVLTHSHTHVCVV